MVLKKINDRFDEFIRQIFNSRLTNRNEWTNAQCEKEFKKLTGESWSFRTLQRRFDQIGNTESVINVRPVYVSASAQPDHFEPVEQPRTSRGMTHSFSNMSIQDVDEVPTLEYSKINEDVSLPSSETDSDMSEVSAKRKGRRKQRPLTLRGETRQASNQKRIRRANLSAEDRAVIRQENSQQQALRRANLSVEELSQIRQENAQQHSHRRANLTIEERNQMRIENALQQSQHRANLSDEERDQMRFDNAHQQSQHRANMSGTEIIQELEANAYQHARRRQHLTETERIEYNSQNAQYQRNRRANMTDEQREFERERNRVYQVNRRQFQSAEEREDERLRTNTRRREAYREMSDDERAEFLGLRRQRQRQRDEENPFFEKAIDNGDPVRTLPHDFGFMNNECQHCGALYFNEEVNTAGKFTLCCMEGKIVIPKIEHFHPDLVRLFQYNENASALDKATRGHFLDNIRQYNSLLAFGGIRANFDPRFFDNRINNQRNRGFVYRVHGRMYFHIPPLFNEAEDQHRLQSAQFHIHDSDLAHQKRVEAWYPDNGQIDENLLSRLENIINSVYPFHRILQNNRNYLRQAANGGEAFDCAMFVTARPTPDQGAPPPNHVNEDLLPGGEIAAVFPGDDPPSNVSIAIHPRLNHRIRVNFRNPLVDSILFPLLFPFGELGYHELTHARETLVLNRTSMKEFYCYRLCIRDCGATPFGNVLFQSGKLFQEYVCQAYMRIEANDLGWQYRNQQQLRVGDYEHIRQIHQRTNPGAEPGDAGYPIILSSTFPGSIRNMRNHYFNIMKMAEHLGKPDIFLTITLNGNRQEISRLLPEDYKKYMNRPDLCSRVFELSMKKFFDLMSKKHVLGRMKAHAGTREYQKTGLPHLHSVWWLEEKIQSAEDLDKYICAEIPDPIEEPELYALVVKYQLHGPCNGTKPCAQEGPTCKKGYPKDFQETTEFSPGQFAKYRRRNNGRTYRKNGQTFSNQHVVPYNKFLLLFFGCHMNIEFCALLLAIAYLFKYMCKGLERVNASITGQQPTNPPPNPQPNQARAQAEASDDEQTAQQERHLNNYIQDQIADADVIIPLNDDQPVIVGGLADPATAALADILNEDLVNPVGDNLQITEEDYNQADEDDTPDEPPNVQPTYDEIRDFQNKRYVSSVEAVEKIFGFSRVISSHTVYNLKIHSPDRQPIIHTTANREQALNRAAATDTMLTAFFKLNREDRNANQYLYEQIPYHYWFDKGSWHVRERTCTTTLARLQFIYPSSRELFHLRLLLQHVRGPRSWDDLLTVNGVLCDSFSAACVARNLVENDQYVRDLLEEGLQHRIHSEVRFLFAHILIHCDPVNPTPLQLWEQYGERMSLDYIGLQHDPVDTALQRSLHHIKHLLGNARKTLADYNLPEPTMNVEWRYRHQNVNLLETTREEYAERVREILPTLNQEQLRAYNAIVNSVENNLQNKLFFIDGPGGTGKTYLINLLLMKMATLGKVCQPLAFTGIAAALMERGQTIHSKFRLKIPSDEDCLSKIAAGTEEARLLCENEVFIIDECSQVDKFMLKGIDRSLRDLTGNRHLKFGGKCIILSGDFRQCLPVVKKPSNHQPETICLKADRVMWESFQKFSLITNVRADMNADAFKAWCMQVGNGLAPKLPNTSLISIPDQVICQNDLIDSVFGEGQLTLDRLQNTNRAILCPTNEDSLEINELILDRLEGRLCDPYFSVDRIQPSNDNVTLPLEHAHQQTPNGFPPHELNLKIGAIVMLIKNWNIPLGLCNGTRMRVVECHRHFIRCAVLSGPRKDQEYSFSKVRFIPGERENHRIERYQFPFRLAFAMTINKSQGQTFDKIGILLRTPVFAHGQLYVAISRVRNFEGLTFMVHTIRSGDSVQGEVVGQVGIFTQNIVNTFVLL